MTGRHAASRSRRPVRHAALLLIPVAALIAAACGRSSSPMATGGTTATGSAVTVPAGSSAQTMTSGGMARTFIVYRPTSLPAGRSVPLVVMLHGGFGTGSQAEKSYGWDAEATAHGFVVAYPDGLNHAWDAGGGCCGKPAQQNVNDVAFVTSVVSTLQHELTIDPNRIYVTGISNGGMLSYRLACDSSVFAAIGPDSATLLGPCLNPKPVSVIHVHGTADQKVPFSGGQGNGPGNIDGPPVPSVIDQFRSVDRCSPPTTAASGIVTTSTAACPEGRAVELITVAGAGHQWPGSVPKPTIEKIMHLDPPSTALDATDVIWKFFAAHPKPGS